MDLLRSPPPSLLDRAWSIASTPFSYLTTLVTSPVSFLLNIPGLSFLLIPTFSSYSTSLNLLFFYLTWSTLILSHPPLKVEFIGTLAIRLLFYILPSIGFLLFDAALPGLAVNIKEHGEPALVLSDEQGGKKNGRWWKMIGVSIGNVLLSVLLQTGIEYLFTQVLHTRSALKVSTTLPIPWGIFKDLFRGLLLREVLTYTLHRYALHSPDSPLAPLHSAWYHALPTTTPLSASYDHPAAYLVHKFLPAYLPAILFRFHLLTYHLYLALISLEELFAYSGYNYLPGGFIMGGIARRQERHLMGDGRGNFGACGLCDLAAGTSIGSDMVEDARDKAEKEEVVERAKGKVRGVGGRKRK